MPEYETGGKDPEVTPTSEPAGAATPDLSQTPPTEDADAASVAQAPAASENNGESGESAEGSEDPDKREKFIPRERFDEVNNKVKALETQAQRAERYKDIIDDLEKEGWADGKTAREALIERNREQTEAQKRQQDDAEWHEELVNDLNAQIERGDISQEWGNDKYNAALLARQNETLRLQTEQVETRTQQAQREQQSQQYAQQVDSQLSALSAQYPDMDADAVRARHYAGQGELTALAQSSHTQNKQRIDRAIAAYAADKNKTASRPAPEGAGGNAPPKPAIPDGSNPAEFWAYLDAEGRKTDQARGY